MKLYAALLLAALLAIGYAPPVGSTTKNVDVTVTSGGTSNEEFVGPFATWMDVTKTAATGGCAGNVSAGATGDGSTDDTTPIQNCLNALSATTPVLWFPAPSVNYKITKTLVLADQINVSVFGADPATTAIVWGGPSSTTTIASFTGTISAVSQNGSGFWNATLTVSGVSGTIAAGQILAGSCVTSSGSPILVHVSASTGGSTYNIVSIGAADTGSCAMTTTWRSMLFMNGTTESNVDRLTFDGNSLVNTGIDYFWDGVTGFFPTSSEFADDVIKNMVGVGFRCGDGSGGCSELSFLRDTFDNDNIAFFIGNQNALNAWFWYSRFTNNATAALSNADPTNGSGNFHAMYSYFNNPGAIDIHWGNGGIWNIVGNYSIGASQFMRTGGGSSPDPAIIQGNTILDTTNPASLFFQSLGPSILLDNVIRNASGNTSPPQVNGNASTDLFSMGNTYTVGTVGTCGGGSAVQTSGRCHSVTPDDHVVSRTTVNPTAPTLPGTPPNHGRTIYEASPTGSGSTCSVASPCSPQGAITAAHNAAVGGAVNPVAHIQVGAYSVATTIDVPADNGIQIIGDGGNSAVGATSALAGLPLMKLHSPSKATLKSFLVGGPSNVDLIQIDGVDQVGALVQTEQFRPGSCSIGVYLDGVTTVAIEGHGVGFGNETTAGMVMTGGRARLFLGSTATIAPFIISGSANFVARGIWTEATIPITTYDVSGTARFTTGGGNVGDPGGTMNQFNSYSGIAAIVGIYTGGTGPITLDGSSSGFNLLGMGIFDTPSGFFNSTNNASGTTEFLNSFLVDGTPLTEVPSTPNQSFLTTTLADLRRTNASPPRMLVSPPGVTDVFIDKIKVNPGGRYCLHLVH